MKYGATAYPRPGRSCPRCNSAVFRVPRRIIDLFMSIFVPLRRYRCSAMDCHWEGNVRNKRFFPSGQGQEEPLERKYYYLESPRMGQITPRAKQSK